MKFTVVGNQIICRRKNGTAENKDPYQKIVAFDAHLDTVAPHVAARLKPEETKQLEEFLVDRKRIQANPTEQNILEALPGLLKEATEILGSGDSVNKTVYKQLSESVAAFSEALHKVKLVSRGRLTMLKSMRGSQAQKERLRDIKEDL